MSQPDRRKIASPCHPILDRHSQDRVLAPIFANNSSIVIAGLLDMKARQLGIDSKVPDESSKEYIERIVPLIRQKMGSATGESD